MAWTSPMTFVANNVLTASQLNTHLRDNMLETAPAKATASTGSYFVAQGPNRLEERITKTQRIATSQTTKSQSYNDLPTVGPLVTVECGARALVFLSCSMSTDTDRAEMAMGFGVSGESDKQATDEKAMSMSGFSINNPIRYGMVFYVDDLNEGQNTFTCKYKTSEGTATFMDRFIGVMPF
jgi:hypothetical protein